MYQIFFLVFLSAVYAQLEVDGPCNFTNVDHQLITSTGIAGTWYQIQRIPNSVENGDCSKSILHISTEIVVGDNTTQIPTLERYDSEVVNGKLVQRNGTITNMTETGVITITYGDVSQDYLILGTDETSYLVVYSCKDNGSRSTISAWMFGRSTTYSAAAANSTGVLIANANINNTVWKTVSHSEAACKISGSVNLQLPPIILLLFVGLALVK